MRCPTMKTDGMLDQHLTAAAAAPLLILLQTTMMKMTNVNGRCNDDVCLAHSSLIEFDAFVNKRRRERDCTII